MLDIKKYFNNSSSTISNLVKFETEINLIVNEIFQTQLNDKKLLVAGNGGSCSDAEHFTGELQCLYKDRDRTYFCNIFSTHPAALTAWSNDFDDSRKDR